MSAVAETNEHNHHDNHHDHAGHGYGDNTKLYVHIFRDDLGSKAGMWLFLFTEILLFGGLFFLYYGYRVAHAQDFHNAAADMNVVLGAVNTIILLTSSLTMVLAIVAMQKNSIKLSLFYMFVTILCAFAFLVDKYFEWSHEIHKGIYPGSEELAMKAKGEILFFGLYYLMTGLHTFHVIVGIVILTICMVFIVKKHINPDKYVILENSGLYWHLVDLIWIFLFPLFYLLH